VLIALRIKDGKQWWELPTVSRDGGGGPVSNGDRVKGNWMEGKCANARTCSRGAREGARGPEEDRIGCEQELVSAARVAAAVELGQEQRDVEDAGQDSTRPVGWRRSSEWHVGEGSGAGLHDGGLRNSDGEVRCTGGRKLSGGQRVAWQGGESRREGGKRRGK
jgi:hypothetical protein